MVSDSGRRRRGGVDGHVGGGGRNGERDAGRRGVRGRGSDMTRVEGSLGGKKRWSVGGVREVRGIGYGERWYGKGEEIEGYRKRKRLGKKGGGHSEGGEADGQWTAA